MGRGTSRKKRHGELCALVDALLMEARDAKNPKVLEAAEALAVQLGLKLKHNEFYHLNLDQVRAGRRPLTVLRNGQLHAAYPDYALLQGHEVTVHLVVPSIVEDLGTEVGVEGPVEGPLLTVHVECTHREVWAAGARDIVGGTVVFEGRTVHVEYRDRNGVVITPARPSARPGGLYEVHDLIPVEVP